MQSSLKEHGLKDGAIISLAESRCVGAMLVREGSLLTMDFGR